MSDVPPVRFRSFCHQHRKMASPTPASPGTPSKLFGFGLSYFYGSADHSGRRSASPTASEKTTSISCDFSDFEPETTTARVTAPASPAPQSLPPSRTGSPFASLLEAISTSTLNRNSRPTTPASLPISMASSTTSLVAQLPATLVIANDSMNQELVHTEYVIRQTPVCISIEHSIQNDARTKTSSPAQLLVTYYAHVIPMLSKAKPDPPETTRFQFFSWYR